ncbi:MarR family winged helix-turn-helix transcriptional regulator [Streptococcus cuniculipharyngis]|uniref:MarR family winged helix-turn-helix transcriptional regulator n=1 Tax=Streptococcus cuniculipharyngis TaxID=1562651 RepID=UPI003CCC6519
MKQLHCQLKRLKTDFDLFASQLARTHDVEHLAGPQGQTLGYLYHHQDEEIFVKDIMREIGISKSVASSLMKRMEKNGFIALVASQKDKRYKQVVLTDLGLLKAEKLKTFFQVLHQNLLTGISQEDLAVAMKVMTQIHHNIQERNRNE